MKEEERVLENDSRNSSRLQIARAKLVATLATKARAEEKKAQEDAESVRKELLTRDWCAARVRDFLREAELGFAERVEDGEEVVFTGVVRYAPASPVDAFPFHIQVLVVQNDGFVTCSFLVPTRAQKAVRAAAAAYCNYVSGSLPIVKLNVNADSGDVEAETVLPIGALIVDAEGELERALAATLGAFESYLPGLYQVFNGVRPETAFAVAREATAKSRRKKRAAAACAEKKLTGSATNAAGMPGLVKDYSLEGLNIVTTIAPSRIVGAVKKFYGGTGEASPDAPRLNLLLSGPPGTGKTEFVKYLAQQVDHPLVTLKASDLLCAHVGETEKALAGAFAQAKEKQAILFLDEVDSFLQRRVYARQSWEVTQVNELLQQMEQFGGVLVGATNNEVHLDTAVLRRFTYKVKLDYLTAEGKRIFYARFFKSPLSKAELARLDTIERLTPGDFRTVRQQLYYLDEKPSNEQRLAALEAEAATKGTNSNRKVGF